MTKVVISHGTKINIFFSLTQNSPYICWW